MTSIHRIVVQGNSESESGHSEETSSKTIGESTQNQLIQSGTGIEDLPNEVLLKILKKLGESDSGTSALVSPKWERIISEGIGFNLDADDDVELIGKFGFNRCEFRELLGDIPSYKIPLLVNEVRFTGAVSQENFKKLLLPLENLRQFKTNIQAISNVNLDEIETLPFPLLKEFTLLYPKYSTLTFARLQNTIKILSKLDCRSLEHLNLVGIPLVRTQEGNVVQAIYGLISKHARTLKKVLVNLQEGRLRNIENLEDNQLSPPIPIPAPAAELVGSNVTKYYLECSCTREPAQEEISNLFSSLLNQQERLNEIYLHTLVPTPFPAQLISKNETTLTSIEWSNLTMDDVLDCGVFTLCSALKVLTLIGRNINNWDANFIAPNQQLSNATSLPATLTSLRIANFLVPSVDAEFMVLRLPNLGLLELLNIGENDTFGVTLETLSQMFLAKTVKSLRIGHGVNELSLTHPQPELAFTATIFLRLSDRQRHKFNVYLDDANQYVFGYGNLLYFRDNSVTFLMGGGPTRAADFDQTSASYKYHDDRLGFNPRFGIEELLDDGEEWFDDDDEDDDADDDDDDEAGLELVDRRVGRGHGLTPVPVDDDDEDNDDVGLFVNPDDDDEESQVSWPPDPEMSQIDLANEAGQETRATPTAVVNVIIEEVDEIPDVLTLLNVITEDLSSVNIVELEAPDQDEVGRNDSNLEIQAVEIGESDFVEATTSEDEANEDVSANDSVPPPDDDTNSDENEDQENSSQQ